MDINLVGNILVLSGLVASFFLGSPVSSIPSGRWVLGEINNPWQAKVHDFLTYVGPIISAAGVILCIISAAKLGWPVSAR